MILWLDAQLPPSLAGWISTSFGVDARALRDLGLRDAEDREIFDAARSQADTVIVSKDSDFVDLVLRLGTPPQVLWVTCGNLTNRRLEAVFREPILLERVEGLAELLDLPADTERVAALTKGQTIGRPLMGDHELAELERRLGRTLRPGKRGRPPSQKNDPRQLKLA